MRLSLLSFIHSDLIQGKDDVADFVEIDFLGVETSKSGDAIALRYSIDGVTQIHVVDGGYLDTGDKLVEHLKKHYGGTVINHVVLTHPDRDHANGLQRVLEQCTVGTLWMNRPWLYAEELISRFETYNSVDALRRKLRELYSASAKLEEIAMQKGVEIKAPFQGALIGAFTVLAPTKTRYLDLVVDSEKTPESAGETVLDAALEGLGRVFRAAKNLVLAAWGDEYFPSGGTSAENEMSVVQTALINGKRILLTGDTGRDGLAEAADYIEAIGVPLPGIWGFQVPHHGGRRNVNTELLDRWLGQRLAEIPQSYTWNAVCSSAAADEDHPRNSVVRAMLHRGAHFVPTEGKNVCLSSGIKREGWSSIAQTPYPPDQERD